MQDRDREGDTVEGIEGDSRELWNTQRADHQHDEGHSAAVEDDLEELAIERAIQEHDGGEGDDRLVGGQTNVAGLAFVQSADIEVAKPQRRGADESESSWYVCGPKLAICQEHDREGNSGADHIHERIEIGPKGAIVVSPAGKALGYRAVDSIEEECEDEPNRRSGEISPHRECDREGAAEEAGKRE